MRAVPLLVALACTPVSVTRVTEPNAVSIDDAKVVSEQETTPVAFERTSLVDVGDSPRTSLPEKPEEGTSPRETHEVAPHPLAGWSAREITDAVRSDPEPLGSMSVGAPNGGALFNSVQLPDDPRWERMAPSQTWGTQETVDYITRAVAKVHEQYPDSPRLHIGHISRREGGYLSPHRSHQAGLDVDIGFYYRPDSHRWYVRGTKETLDLPRTWALVRAFVTETDARFILIDHSIQHLLREYALSIGENAEWVHELFVGRGANRPPIIRHAKGHATHLHVRFYNPIAEETGRRSYPALVSVGAIKPAQRFVDYKAKKGDTLLALAKRFNTTVKAIKRVNGLRSNTILAKRIYKIPAVGHSVSQARGYELPPRRLPPNDLNGASPIQPPRNIEDDNNQGCFSDGGGDCE